MAGSDGGKGILILIIIFAIFLILFFALQYLRENNDEIIEEEIKIEHTGIFYFITHNDELYIKENNVLYVNIENEELEKRITNLKQEGDYFILSLSNLVVPSNLTIGYRIRNEILESDVINYNPKNVFPNINFNFISLDSIKRENVHFIQSQKISFILESDSSYRCLYSFDMKTFSEYFQTNRLNEIELPIEYKDSGYVLNFFCIDKKGYASFILKEKIIIEEIEKSVFLFGKTNSFFKNLIPINAYTIGFREQDNCNLYLNDNFLIRLDAKEKISYNIYLEDIYEYIEIKDILKVHLICRDVLENKEIKSNVELFNIITDFKESDIFFKINNEENITSSPLVTLNMNFIGATRCRFKNDNESFGLLKVYEPEIEWILNEKTGERTVSVECFDQRGISFGIFNDSIYLKGRPSDWIIRPYNLKIEETYYQKDSPFLSFKIYAENAKECRLSSNFVNWTDWFSYKPGIEKDWYLLSSFHNIIPLNVNRRLKTVNNIEMENIHYRGFSNLFLECRNEEEIKSHIKKEYLLDMIRYDKNIYFKAHALSSGRVLFDFSNDSKSVFSRKIYRRENKNKNFEFIANVNTDIFIDHVKKTSNVEYRILFFDEFGRQITTSLLDILVDANPPEIEILSPIMDATYSNVVPVSINVKDDISDKIFCEITINNEKEIVEIFSNEFFEIKEIPPKTPFQNMNFIYVVCYDEVGNGAIGRTIYFNNT